jgi:hypothetical protein
MLPSDVLAGAPAGPRRLDAAHCEQAPFMYEMKGALFVCVWPPPELPYPAEE